MNRRQLLGLQALTQHPAGIIPGKVSRVAEINPYMNKEIPTDITTAASGLGTYAGTWGVKEAAHLLRRTTFGFSWAQLNQVKAMNVNDAVDLLLNVSNTPPSPPVNNYNNAQYTDPDIPAGQTWVNGPRGDGDANFRRVYSFKSWFMGLMFNEGLSIREKMTWFWHNHFATETETVLDARYVYKNNALLRANIFGNFKTLVKSVTVDPAMLIYLNGSYNTKSAPDENYARELMELFTLGKGPDSQYTEDDVKAAAKVLTGWKDDPINISSLFVGVRHDANNKQFSSFFNNTVIAGKSGNSGADETDELIDMIFQKEDVIARFMVRKLYRYFIYYVIDDTTEQNVIIPLANLFKTNWNVKEVLEVLLKSEHFYDTLNQACYIKNPIDFLGSLVKNFNMEIPNPGYEVQYYYWQVLVSTAVLLQMDPGDPPNVSGWPAYYQEPQFHELWINTDTLPRRNQITDVLNYASVNYKGNSMSIDHCAYADSLPSPADPNLLIDDLCTLMLQYPIDPTQKAEMKTSYLLFGQTSDHYWTDLWNQYKSNTSDPNVKGMVVQRLQALFKYIINLPEYQLA